jgi:ribosome-associated protein YbcJ (S4-like RNA binding protein)
VCDDDEEAKRRTKQMEDGHAIELWQQARKVASFEPEK